MSIDLGTDFTKVAVVRPGLPMEIALDSTSKRTIPTVLVLKEGNRLFGNGAMTKDPKVVFSELPSIIGKTLDHPTVKAYLKRYPYHNLVFSSEYNQLAFIVNGKEYTVETLLAMFLKYVRRTAETFANSEMKTAVITVPTFFSQSERRAILRAANLADIDVIQLLSNNLAVALDFIHNRVKLINDKPVYAFFDVGATGTTATIVSYESAKANGETTGEHPHVFIRGTASDTTLGTNVFIDRLVAHLIKKFREAHKIDGNIKNARTLAKFRMEASRVFKVLSANKEIFAVAEEIYDGLDLRVKVSRDDLEEMCKDLIDRMPSILQSAIEVAKNFLVNVGSDLRDLIGFGGGTRIPAVQAAILSLTNKTTVAKSVNSDEAAAMGAIYQAAANTRGFLVKRIVLRDMTRYPIAITFPRINTSADSTKEELVTKTLFPANNLFPQKRTIKFPRLEKDIAFHVHYGETPADHSSYLQGGSTILKVNISGVNEAIENFQKSGNEPQAVKVHLELDASGILQTSEVNLIMAHEEIGKSTIGRLTDGISSLFGSGDQKETKQEDTEQKTTETPSPTTDQPSSYDTKQYEGSSTTQSTEPTETTITTPVPPLQKTMVHPLTFHVEILDSVNPPSESVGASMKILYEFDAADKERDLLYEARNELERTIYSTRRDIEKDFIDHTTKEEIDNLNTITKEISLWYDDESHYAPRSAIEEHLGRLREIVDPIRSRIKAFAELPQALTALKEILTSTAEPIKLVMEVNSASNTLTASEYILTLNDSLTEEEENRKTGLPIYSLEDVENMKKIIAATKTFLKETKDTLDKCDKRADPPVRLVTVTEKAAALTAKLEYYGHKGEIWFTTYKRLFLIKKEALAMAAKAANTTINATEANETLFELPTEADEEFADAADVKDQVTEESSVTEEPTENLKSETSTPRSPRFDGSLHCV
ncbi:hypothetical protein ACTXT7_012448 [Hymenolepis weldensis]